MEKSKTCCFTGHRKLPQDKIEQILIRLNQEVDNLISQGVTDFISGGAIGFDQIAASLIVAKKEMGNDIRLIFALPCRNQDMLWSTEQKRLYRGLLDEADEIIYVSEEYTNDCMKKRNQYMVEMSAYCICAQIYETGGTAQTVRYARSKGLKISNVSK
ncbi:MAG: SLOG family protein [Christensenella sp.]